MECSGPKVEGQGFSPAKSLTSLLGLQPWAASAPVRKLTLRAHRRTRYIGTSLETLKKRTMVQKRKASTRRQTKKRTNVSASARARIPITARDRSAGVWFARLVALQARLRAPNGCPWD